MPSDGAPAWPMAALLKGLAVAELAFAEFNAQRTSSAESALIGRGGSPHFHWLFDRSRPDSAYYNRALARGTGPLPPEALGELPADVAAVELQPAQLQPPVGAGLLALGLRPAAALCYLACLPPAQPLPTGLQVERLNADQTELFFDLLACSGVPFPPERREAKRRFYCTPGFQAFVARGADGQALGWATLFLQGGSAFFGNAYTRPERRGQGAHAALLAARLNAAAQARVSAVYTDVEHGSPSHFNVERAGFRTLSINTIWSRGG